MISSSSSSRSERRRCSMSMSACIACSSRGDDTDPGIELLVHLVGAFADRLRLVVDAALVGQHDAVPFARLSARSPSLDRNSAPRAISSARSGMASRRCRSWSRVMSLLLHEQQRFELFDAHVRVRPRSLSVVRPCSAAGDAAASSAEPWSWWSVGTVVAVGAVVTTGVGGSVVVGPKLIGAR